MGIEITGLEGPKREPWVGNVQYETIVSFLKWLRHQEHLDEIHDMTDEDTREMAIQYLERD